MTKKIGLMALGLSMVLLSGCGGSSSDDDGGTPPPGTDLNTPSEVTKNIVGSWDGGCVNNVGASWTDRVTFNADGTAVVQGAEYDAQGCNPADEIDSWDFVATYTIGEATTGSAGEDAVELDADLSEIGEGNLYTMVHFNSVNEFQMGSSDEDGSTPAERENVFSEDEVFTRQ